MFSQHEVAEVKKKKKLITSTLQLYFGISFLCLQKNSEISHYVKIKSISVLVF